MASPYSPFLYRTNEDTTDIAYAAVSEDLHGAHFTASKRAIN